MKQRSLVLGAATILTLAACEWDRNVVPEFQMDPLGVATLNAAGVVPASTSGATGTVEFFTGAGTKAGWIDYTVNIQDIQGLTGLRLYRGGVGVTTTKIHNLMYEAAALVVNPNAPGTFTMRGNWAGEEVAPLTFDSLRALAAAGQLYVQAITVTNPGGDIGGLVNRN